MAAYMHMSKCRVFEGGQSNRAQNDNPEAQHLPFQMTVHSSASKEINARQRDLKSCQYYHCHNYPFEVPQYEVLAKHRKNMQDLSSPEESTGQF